MWKTVLKRRLMVCGITLTVMVFVFGSYYGIVGGQPSRLPHVSSRFDGNTVGKEITLLTTMDKLKSLNQSEFLMFIHRYTNTYQILCRNQLRVGTIYDSGKDVCIDDPILPKKPCLVYSFGSQNRFKFEKDVIKWFGCEVHTFDPSMDHLNETMVKNPPGCTFHRTGLGSENIVTNNNWTLRTLGTTIKELHHENRVLDILKVDAEGAEWKALDEITESGVISRVKQLLVELHFGKIEKNTAGVIVLKKLYDAGLRMFNRERNTFCRSCVFNKSHLGFVIPRNVEMCFINTRFIKNGIKE